jgi:hypothetical protein
MSTWPVWFVNSFYCLQAIICIRNNQFPQVAMLGGYVIANLGLIWSMS